MVSRPTVADLARAAGVSVATVDRVLNRRLPVRRETAARVLEAAEAIGYHASGLLRHRAAIAAPARTLGFLLQRPDAFYQALAADLARATEAAPMIRGRPLVYFMDDLSPGTIVERLHRMAERADAIAVVAVDHPNVSAAIAELARRGVPVFTLLSDLTAEARAGYIGLDGRKTGRTAAWMVAHTARAPGTVGILVGSHRYLGQELSEISFRSYMREHAPAFRLLETLINLDHPHIAYDAVLDLMRKNPDLVGLYTAGGGADGVLQAVRDEGLAGRVAVVCNELTASTRAALVDGVATMVLSTPTAALAARAVEVMAAALEGAGTGGPVQIYLPFEMYVSENI